MTVGEDFKNYYVNHLGKSASSFDDYLNQLRFSMTPYILEERELRATQMDIFSRLMHDRILWISGVVDDYMADVVQAQLLFLDNRDSADITMHIATGGGSVSAGLAIVDIMNYVACDIRTVNMRIAASMGSVLLGAGTKGKRSSLLHSKTMLHQSSGGAVGNIQDAEITWKEWTKVNDELFKLLGEYCGKEPEQVKQDSSRDLWLDSQEALEYGIIDEIVKTKKKI